MPRHRLPIQIEKDHQAAELRSRGETFETIGKAFGVARQTAYIMVQRAIADIPTEKTEQLKKMESLKLDAVERMAYQIAMKKHPAFAASGKIVTRVIQTDEGLREVEVEDDTPILRALDTLLKVSERRAKLLGLNAPTNIRLETTVYDASSIDREFEQFRSLIAGLDNQKALVDPQQGETGATTTGD